MIDYPFIMAMGCPREDIWAGTLMVLVRLQKANELLEVEHGCPWAF